MTAHPGVDSRPLALLRRRLTAWYAATFGVILLLLGGGLYATIHEQIARELHSSLASATHELSRAARIREMESRDASGKVVDAVQELHIPDRHLYLLDSTGAGVTPLHVAPWVTAAARRAASAGQSDDVKQLGD